MPGEHILIVDDERAIRTTLRGVLEDEGYRVTAVGSGEEAIARIQEETPDIRRTGPFLYLRLRRSTYTDAELDGWARRLVPFLDDGLDAFVLFRHDEDGTSAIRAEGFAERVERVRVAG